MKIKNVDCVLLTTIIKARNYCQDVDHCTTIRKARNDCQDVERCQDGNRCQDRDPSQNGNKHTDDQHQWSTLNIIIASIFNMVLLDHDHKLTQCLQYLLMNIFTMLSSYGDRLLEIKLKV